MQAARLLGEPYQYNTKGEGEYTAQNLMGSGNFDWNADRIIRSVSEVVQQ